MIFLAHQPVHYEYVVNETRVDTEQSQVQQALQQLSEAKDNYFAIFHSILSQSKNQKAQKYLELKIEAGKLEASALQAQEAIREIAQADKEKGQAFKKEYEAIFDELYELMDQTLKQFIPQAEEEVQKKQEAITSKTSISLTAYLALQDAVQKLEKLTIESNREIKRIQRLRHFDIS